MLLVRRVRDRWSAPQVLAAALGGLLAAAVALSGPGSGDWLYYQYAVTNTWGLDGLRIYELHTFLQTGPIHLVVVYGADMLGGAGLPLVVAAAGIATMVMLGDLAVRHGRPLACLGIGGTVLALWWPYLRTWGHADDALVLMVAVAALLLLERGDHAAGAVAVGLTLAIKPWGIFLLPLTVRRGGIRQWLAGPVTAVVVGGVFWLPFFAASPFGTLGSFAPKTILAPASVVRLFGVTDESAFTTEVRLLQLTICCAVAAVAMLRGRPGAVLLGGVAARMMLDPGAFNYYTVGLLVGALLWDLTVSSARLPWATLVTTVLVPPTWLIDSLVIGRSMRLAACLLAVAVVMWPSPRAARAANDDEGADAHRSVRSLEAVVT